MRDHDDESDDAEVAEEDALALQALAALLEVDGDDELAQAQREALAAVADEAMALKARREAREERRAAERRAATRARREEQERAERKQAARVAAARVEAARQARAAREAAEARAGVEARAAREERARREQDARREALRRQRAAELRQAVRAPSCPVSPPTRPTPAVEHAEPRASIPPLVLVAKPSTGEQPRAVAEKPEPLKEPDRFLQDVPLSLTGADLSAWRSRHRLTQQAAADRLGVRQGTVSKGESRGSADLGPALRDALAEALAAE